MVAEASLFKSVVPHLAEVIEGIGVCVMILGGVAASFIYLKSLSQKSISAYEEYRKNLGRAILLGLEFLVAGDIIGTIAVKPTFTSLGVLGLIVLIRTFLSLSLTVEIEGRWPWHNQKD